MLRGGWPTGWSWRVAPVLLGKGTEAVGDLGASAVTDGLRLANRTVHQAGPDLLIAGDLDAAPAVLTRRSASRAPSIGRSRSQSSPASPNALAARSPGPDPAAARAPPIASPGPPRPASSPVSSQLERPLEANPRTSPRSSATSAWVLEPPPVDAQDRPHPAASLAEA
jgi:hypothetical protein